MGPLPSAAKESEAPTSLQSDSTKSVRFAEDIEAPPGIESEATPVHHEKVSVESPRQCSVMEVLRDMNTSDTLRLKTIVSCKCKSGEPVYVICKGPEKCKKADKNCPRRTLYRVKHSDMHMHKLPLNDGEFVFIATNRPEVVKQVSRHYSSLPAEHRTSSTVCFHLLQLSGLRSVEKPLERSLTRYVPGRSSDAAVPEVP